MSNPHDAPISPPDGELGDLEASAPPFASRKQGADADRRSRLGALTEPLLHRLDDLVEGEPALQVLFGSEPDLGVDDAVVGEVLGALARDARERAARLHHADGVRERLEVQDEVSSGPRLASSTRRARRGRSWGDPCSRSRRRAPRSSRRGARRPGDRAAGPSGLGGSPQASASRSAILGRPFGKPDVER